MDSNWYHYNTLRSELWLQIGYERNPVLSGAKNRVSD